LEVLVPAGVGQSGGDGRRHCFAAWLKPGEV
jgi:hypothetical protein